MFAGMKVAPPLYIISERMYIYIYMHMSGFFQVSMVSNPTSKARDIASKIP